MHRTVALLLLVVALVLPSLSPRVAGARVVAQPADAPVVVLAVDGIINPLTARYLERSLRQAEASDAALVVVMLDTPGGLDASMRAMVEALLNAPVPTVVYVAPSGARAASAGMFITIAADVAAMAPATNIGAASPVALGGTAGETELAKATSDAAALARAIAERRGRNADWVERAVVESVSLTAREARDENVIDVVAENLDDLLRQVDGREVDVAGGTVRLRTAGAPVEQRPMSVGEQLIHIISDPNIAYLLLTLGTLLLLAELAAPGLSIAGAGSAIAYILAFMALGSLPVNWAGLALLAVAVVFFVAGFLTDTEVVLGTGGLIAFILGSVLLFSPFEAPSPAAPVVRVSAWLIGGMAVVMAAFVLIVLAAVVRARRLPPQSGPERLVGLEGIALSDLNPGGQVRVDTEMWSAVSTAGEIRSGERVRVVGFAGVRLRVVPADLERVWERTEEA